MEDTNLTLSQKNALNSVFFSNKRYIRLSALGETPVHKIELALDLENSQEVVIKSAQKDETNLPFFEEHQLLSRLPPHPAVVSTLERFDDESREYFVMKFAGRLNLYQYLNKFGKFDERNARTLFRKICQAVQHLHHNGIVHADIKPENIVLEGAELEPVLIDFESARNCKKKIMSDTFRVDLASFPYSAPELMCGNVEMKRAPKVDIWSLGVLLYVILCCRWPWTETEWSTFKDKPRLPVEPELSEPTRKLITATLRPKPQQRSSLKEILNDPWLTEKSLLFSPGSMKLKKSTSSGELNRDVLDEKNSCKGAKRRILFWRKGNAKSLENVISKHFSEQ